MSGENIIVDWENLPGISGSEMKTRMELIDKELKDAGWTKNVDWIDEMELNGIPTYTGKGYADYVLLDPAGRPLAVIEAKKVTRDAAVGREQAREYAEALRNKYGRMPVIFLHNGYKRIIIDRFGERWIHGLYSRDDLMKYFNLERSSAKTLSSAIIDTSIVDRDCGQRAIRAVLRNFESGNRMSLVVMATGTGKTRMSIGLIKAMTDMGWVKNVLYLADRVVLVSNPLRKMEQFLPNIHSTRLDTVNPDLGARIVVSTLPTMSNAIDKLKDENGHSILTAGHFDLVIIDEAHRSIYNKYTAIFNHFDAMVLGMTATPKDDIDRNTFHFFGIDGADPQPTFGYELPEGIADGYLVGYRAIVTDTKFMRDGMNPDEMDDDERAAYLSTVGRSYPVVAPSQMNTYVFNYDTIAKVLNDLMTKGLKIDAGSRVGKTIIFARNHRHAEAIKSVFDKEYPILAKMGFCEVIDNYLERADVMIDKFEDPNSMPQIAISVDMLDTGVDVEEILNLVFFKPVFSKTKFNQMIGRGTRTCEGLIDGKDKEFFLIFDYCGNFDFFHMKPEGLVLKDTGSIQGRIFLLRSHIALILQDVRYQEEGLVNYRKETADYCQARVAELNRGNYAVKQHLRAVDEYTPRPKWDKLSENDLNILAQEICPLLPREESDFDAMGFAALVFAAERSKLWNDPGARSLRAIRLKVEMVSRHGNLPQVAAKIPLIKSVLEEGVLERFDVLQLENLRKELRDLMDLSKGEEGLRFSTNFLDDIIGTEERPMEDAPSKFTRYRDRLDRYLREHADVECIKKIHENEPLDRNDLAELEKILYEDIGTKEECDLEFPGKPIIRLVRESIGLDRDAAWKALWQFIDETDLNDDQIYFLKQIVEHVARNGVIDKSVLTQEPFNARGDITALFGAHLDQWSSIKKAIALINHNGGAGSI
jgi:type I restriction enzyme R subunit